MAGLFISYSRKDVEIARRLTQAFQDRGLDFWIDWEGIPPTVDWWKEIQKGIEEADIFLFLLSPDSAKSNICKQEIEHAVKNGKRLIPIVVRDVQRDVPSELLHLNWIFIRKRTDFAQATDSLMTAIHTDYEWVQVHRQLQNKALEWQRNNFEVSFLLRGKELQEAEFQLRANASKEPSPTVLQQQYVHRSRQSTNRQMRVLGGVGIAAVLAIVLLGIYGWVQAGYATMNAETAQAESTRAFNNAEIAQAESTRAFDNAATAQANATIARAGQLAAQAVSQRELDFDLSLLLSVEAFRTQDTLQTKTTLLDNTQTNPQLIQYKHGQNASGSSIALSPDGKTVAYGTEDGTILLWDLESDEQTTRRLKGHDYAVSSVAFSVDGKTLASGGCKIQEAFCLRGEIILWDVATGQSIGQLLSGYSYSAISIAFSPDGKTLAESRGEAIIVWDVSTQLHRGFASDPIDDEVPIGVLSKAGANTVIFSPTGQLLASGDNSGAITLWNVASQQPVGKLNRGQMYGAINSIAFSPDGEILASGSDSGSVSLWSLDTLQPIGPALAGHYGPVNSVSFSTDGKTLASGSDDFTVVLWDILGIPFSEQTRLSLVGQGDKVIAVAFQPDGKIVVSGSLDNTVALWDVSHRQPIAQTLRELDEPTSIAFSPDGKTLAVGDWIPDSVSLWDVERNQSIGQPLDEHSTRVHSVAFSLDGKIWLLEATMVGLLSGMPRPTR